MRSDSARSFRDFQWRIWTALGVGKVAMLVDRVWDKLSIWDFLGLGSYCREQTWFIWGWSLGENLGER